MWVVAEKDITELMTPETAFDTVEAVFASMAQGEAYNFPVVRENKRELARSYSAYFSGLGIDTLAERPGTEANYWLNGIFTESRENRDAFLQYAAEHKIQARPAWTLMPDLPMYKACASGPIPTARWLEERIICLPSSFRPGS